MFSGARTQHISGTFPHALLCVVIKRGQVLFCVHCEVVVCVFTELGTLKAGLWRILAGKNEIVCTRLLV